MRARREHTYHDPAGAHQPSCHVRRYKGVHQQGTPVVHSDDMYNEKDHGRWITSARPCPDPVLGSRGALSQHTRSAKCSVDEVRLLGRMLKEDGCRTRGALKSLCGHGRRAHRDHHLQLQLHRRQLRQLRRRHVQRVNRPRWQRVLPWRAWVRHWRARLGRPWNAPAAAAARKAARRIREGERVELSKMTKLTSGRIREGDRSE